MRNGWVRKGLTIMGGGMLLITTLGFSTVPKTAMLALQASMTTNKARYNPAEPVKFKVTVTNPNDGILSGNLYLAVNHLGEPTGSLSPQRISVPGKSSRIYVLTWTPLTKDYQGYFVGGVIRSQAGSILARVATAIDVSSSWVKFPRYGFVSEYPQMSRTAVKHELAQLKNYHIDGLQFYDWQWKHDIPLAGTVSHPAASWHDIAGRTNYRQTILNMIQVGHQLGMASFNYNLMYGAWAGYQTDGSGVKSAWGLYYDNGGALQVSVSMPAGWSTSAIDVFNPGNSGWRQYILHQEANVFKTYPFDGWQVDQLGNQGTVFDAKGQQVHLQATFTPFLNDAARFLRKQIIFNNVGGYGLQSVAAHSNESVAYVECWPNSGQATFNDLKTTIDSINALSKGKKSAILAAYLDSTYANSFSGQNPGYFNNAGVLLADATIFASGGDHIELGDNLQMLNAPYFPNHNLIMDAALKEKLLSYYNFMVAYENLLRGGLVNTENSVALHGLKVSQDGLPQTVWAFTKAGGGYEVIQLINLYRQTTNLWQDSSASTPTPPTFHNVQVKYYVGQEKVQGVYAASPDFQNGAATQLKYTYSVSKGKRYISFTVPSLQYWDMIYLKKTT